MLSYSIRNHQLKLRKIDSMSLQNLDPTYLETCRNALSQEQSKSLAETDHWAHVDRTQVHADWDALYKTLAGVIDTSTASDTHIQELLAQHYTIACRFYTPSPAAYLGMALFYQDNPGMRDFHNAYHPQMVNFLGDAMCVYAAKL